MLPSCRDHINSSGTVRPQNLAVAKKAKPVEMCLDCGEVGMCFHKSIAILGAGLCLLSNTELHWEAGQSHSTQWELQAALWELSSEQSMATAPSVRRLEHIRPSIPSVKWRHCSTFLNQCSDASSAGLIESLIQSPFRHMRDFNGLWLRPHIPSIQTTARTAVTLSFCIGVPKKYTA